MNGTEKNVILITAGGCGSRMRSDIPKQYMLLNGKPVIEYVIDACKKSELTEGIVVACSKEYQKFILEKYCVDVCDSGELLNITKRKAFDYIKKESKCEKLVVVESVRPTVTTESIDFTFQKLDQYEAVACARYITDSIGCYDEWILDRSKFFTLNPPEGFNFKILDQHFKGDSVLTESIQQLPNTIKMYLNFDAPYFGKLTYKEDFNALEAYMEYCNKKHE